MTLQLRSLNLALHPDLRVVDCGAGILVGLPRPERRLLGLRAASDRARLPDRTTSSHGKELCEAALGSSGRAKSYICFTP